MLRNGKNLLHNYIYIADQSQNQDLGLGSKVIEQNRMRFVNPDGSFNVRKKGFGRGSRSLYHEILNMGWGKFYAWLVGLYFVGTSVFALLYLLTGVPAFPAIAGLPMRQRFGELFFFSVQVITTLGSSPLHPATIPSHIVMAMEALFGIISFAIAAGLIFARFSNPAVKILFSRTAVMAPYQGITAFMFRIINVRNNELVQVSATVTLSMNDKTGKRVVRQLSLERDSVLVFPVNWTIVHPITDSSPMHGMSEQDLINSKAEFLINITAMDKELSRQVYARYSYLFDEITFNAKFAYILETAPDGSIEVDPRRVHEIEELTAQ